MTNTSGCPGIDRSGFTSTRPARSVGAPSVAPRGDAATPAAHKIVSAAIENALVSTRDAATTRHRRARANVHAETLEIVARGLAERFRKRREQIRPGLEEDDPGRSRIEMAEVPCERFPRDLGQRPSQLDAGWSSAHDDEREERLSARWIRLALGAFERHEHTAPDLERVLETLQTRRVRLPFIVSEIRMGRAGGHDQVVVRDFCAIRQMDGVLCGLDAIDFAEEDLDVPLPPQNPPDGRRNVSWRQACGRHLIEKRLKHVMIAAIDNGDVDGGTAQGARRIQPTKSPTNDEHTWHLFQQYVIGCSFGEQVNRTSGVRCQTSVSDVRCQMSDVRCQTSNVGCRMSDVSGSRRSSEVRPRPMVRRRSWHGRVRWRRALPRQAAWTSRALRERA